MTGSFAKDSAVSFSANIVLLPLSVIGGIVIARALGPVGKGEYALITLAGAMLARLGNSGVGTSVVYHIGQGGDRRGDIVPNALMVSLGLSSLMVLGFLVFYNSFGSQVFAGVTLSLLLAGVAMTPVTLAGQYLQQSLVALGGVVDYSLINVLGKVTGVLLAILFVVVFRLAVFGAVLAGIIVSLVMCVSFFWRVRRRCPMILSVDVGLMKRLLGFGLRVHLGGLTMFLTYRLDMFFVNAFVGTEGVGFYALGVNAAELLLFLSQSIALILLPRVSSWSARESDKLVPVVARNAALLTSLGALGLLVCGRSVIFYLYGPAFLPALVPMLMLLPGVVFLAVTKILSTYIVGRGRPLIDSLVAVSALMFTVILDLRFIPVWGIAGAALASTFSYFLTFLIALLIFTRMSGASVLDTLVVRAEDLALYVQAVLRIRSRIA
jgi:O-antigen/teichoic acid export membrane protein